MSAQLSILDAIAEGERLAKEGINHAADKNGSGWKERCWNLFIEWIMNKPVGYHFMIEEFRLHVEAQKKLEKPNSNRAFGFLSVEARKKNLIESAGMAKVKNETAHRCYANIWCVV